METNPDQSADAEDQPTNNPVEEPVVKRKAATAAATLARKRKTAAARRKRSKQAAEPVAKELSEINSLDDVRDLVNDGIDKLKKASTDDFKDAAKNLANRALRGWHRLLEGGGERLMFGLLGWLFGASFVSAIASWLVVAIYNALIPEITAATAAARTALHTSVWGAVTGGVGMIGFKRQARKWRRRFPALDKED